MVIKSGCSLALLNAIIFFHSFSDSAMKNTINPTVELAKQHKISPFQPEILPHICLLAYFLPAKNE